MNQHERLARIPQDKHITYYQYRNGLYYAFWHEQGKQQGVYLGMDTDGSFAARMVSQRHYKPRSTALACGHTETHLNCEVCIRAVTWQMRAQST